MFARPQSIALVPNAERNLQPIVSPLLKARKKTLFECPSMPALSLPDQIMTKLTKICKTLTLSATIVLRNAIKQPLPARFLLA
jgi:thymidine kinase